MFVILKNNDVWTWNTATLDPFEYNNEGYWNLLKSTISTGILSYFNLCYNEVNNNKYIH